MLLRGRSNPRAVHWARGVSCGGCDELVRCRTKRTVRTKSNSLEANVEALLLDDLVRAAILGGSVRISAGTLWACRWRALPPLKMPVIRLPSPIAQPSWRATRARPPVI